MACGGSGDAASDGGLRDGGSVRERDSGPLRDPGRLTFVDFYKNIKNGRNRLTAARAVALGPGDGDHLYAVSAVNQSINVFTRNVASSELTLVQTLDALEGQISEALNLNWIAFSPDGKHMYTAATQGVSLGTVHQLSRDGTTGRLTLQVIYNNRSSDSITHLHSATAVEVDPDGEFVYVSASSSSAVTIFSRDASTGNLSQVGVQTDEVLRPEALGLSPDGSTLYVANDGARITVFSRNSTTGLLSFVEAHTNGVGGVEGLLGVRAFAVDSAGRHLYAVSQHDGAVAVFDRAGDGKLTFQSAVKNGQGGTTNLTGAYFLAISPDDRQVYVNGDSALLTFDRNTSTGALTYVESHVDGVPPVDGLFGGGGVAVSGDGRSVYATGRTDGAVVAFRRD